MAKQNKTELKGIILIIRFAKPFSIYYKGITKISVEKVNTKVFLGCYKVSPHFNFSQSKILYSNYAQLFSINAYSFINLCSKQKKFLKLFPNYINIISTVVLACNDVCHKQSTSLANKL